jgi:hypothetical protein
VEGGASADVRRHPNLAAVPLHYPLAYGQADAGARNILTVKAPQRREDAVVVFGIDSPAIVTDGESIQVRLDLFRRDMNPRRDIRAGIFNSVCNWNNCSN